MIVAHFSLNGARRIDRHAASGSRCREARNHQEQQIQRLPDSLNDAPFLLPSQGTSLRRSFDHWQVGSQLTLQIVGEFDDTALMKVFAEADLGFVPSPLAIEADIEQRFSLNRVMTLPNAKETFFAITADRKLRHPAIVAISEFARTSLFDQQSS